MSAAREPPFASTSNSPSAQPLGAEKGRVPSVGNSPMTVRTPVCGSIHRARAILSVIILKQDAFAVSYSSPAQETIEELSVPDCDMDKLCNANIFNSSINGQLELRWRFVNALRASKSKNALVVSERHVPILPPDLMAGDRFYWRLNLSPNPNVAGHWRRVDMSNDSRREIQPSKHRVLRIVFS